MTTIVRLHDADGNRLVWFASGEREPKDGETWHVRGTVKAQRINRKYGNKETVLTRVQEVDENGKPVKYTYDYETGKFLRNGVPWVEVKEAVVA